MLAGYSDRIRTEQQGRAWLAYHIGLMVRSSDPPSYDDLLGRTAAPQSDEDVTFNLAAFASATQHRGGQ